MPSKKIFVITFFFASLFCGAICYFSLNQKTVTPKVVSTNLAAIPAEDRLLIERLFRHLLISERFAYTLYGEKPLSMSFCLHTKDSVEQKSTYTYPFTLRQWHTWERYHHLFPSHNFALRQIAASAPGESWILLINKNRLLKTVNKHLPFFRAVHGKGISAKKILHLFLTHPDPLEAALKNRQLLKGILLGYGKHNAFLFERKQVVEEALLEEGSHILPTSPFQTLQEELQHLTHQLRPFSPNDRYPLRLPVFLADPSARETQNLKAKYTKEREQILPIIKNTPSFLENTLTAFTNG